ASFEPAEADALGRIRSGRNPADGHEGERIVLVALGFDRAALDELAQRVIDMQEASDVIPIFLIDDVDSTPLDGRGFQYESIMTLAEHGKYAELGYEQNVRACVDGLRFRYQADTVVTLVPNHVEQSANQLMKVIET
ncbi:MAG TPA: hypothetical protein VIW94_08205, partial [Acidimicrobiia bacterium]